MTTYNITVSQTIVEDYIDKFPPNPTEGALAEILKEEILKEINDEIIKEVLAEQVYDGVYGCQTQKN